MECIHFSLYFCQIKLYDRNNHNNNINNNSGNTMLAIVNDYTVQEKGGKNAKWQLK